MSVLKLAAILSIITYVHAGFFDSAVKFVKKNSYCALSECCEDVYVNNKIPGTKSHTMSQTG